MKRLIVYLLHIVLFISAVDAQVKRPTYKKYNKQSQPLSSNDDFFNGTINLNLSAFGPSFLFGDVGGSTGEKALLGLNDWDIADTKTYWGLGGSVLFPSNIGIKGDLHYGKFTGSDVGSRMGQNRNWSYTSTIFEGTLQGMFVVMGGPYDLKGKSHMLYFMGGVGQMLVYSDPQGDKVNRDVNGDLTKTSEYTPVIPFGLGYQYRASHSLSVGVEFTYHYALSDFLDGWSSKYSKWDDGIGAANFTVAYQLFGVECKTCEWSHQSMQGPIIKKRR